MCVECVFVGNFHLVYVGRRLSHKRNGEREKAGEGVNAEMERRCVCVC